MTVYTAPVDTTLWRANYQIAKYLEGNNSKIGKVFSGQNLSIEDLEIRLGTVESETDDNTATIAINYTTLTDADSALASRTLTLETDVNDVTTGLSSKSSITYVDTSISGLEGSTASSLSVIEAAYQAGDASLLSDINEVADDVSDLTTVVSSKASVSELATASATAADATATLEASVNASIAAIPASTSNRVHYTEFENESAWKLQWNPDGIAGTITFSYYNGVDYVNIPYTATASGQRLFYGSDEISHPIRVNAGERICVQSGVESQGPTQSVQLRIKIYDIYNNVIIEPTIASRNGTFSFNTKLFGFYTLPSNANYIRISAFLTTSGSGSGKITMSEPMVSSAHADQTSRPEYVRGIYAEAGADVTANSDAFAALDASVTVVQIATASLEEGVSSSYQLKGKAGTSEFEFVGFADGVAPSTMRLSADQIELDGDVVVTGSLTTGKLESNAVTIGQTTEIDGDLTVTADWQDAATAAVTVVSGAEVDLQWSIALRATASYLSADDGGTVYVRLLRDTTVIYTDTPVGYSPPATRLVSLTESGGGSAVLYDLDIGSEAYSHPSGMDTDIPSAGTYTYKLQVKKYGGPWIASKRRLKYVLRKR